MTIVVGKIESLKSLKEVLEFNGISRFDSIAEINKFLKNYESEKSDIPGIVKIELDEEIEKLGVASKDIIEKSNKNVFNKIRYESPPVL